MWSDSTTQEVPFQPLSKKAAVRLWHRARDFDRQTRRPGRHGGAVGHAALQVLHALIFDFLNYASGRLDPSYAAIARAANVSERTVASALKRLRAVGILDWSRRCSWAREEGGRFVLRQETNAYAVLPPSQWRGYRGPPEAPPPKPGTWGDAFSADDRVPHGPTPLSELGFRGWQKRRRDEAFEALESTTSRSPDYRAPDPITRWSGGGLSHFCSMMRWDEADFPPSAAEQGWRREWVREGESYE